MSMGIVANAVRTILKGYAFLFCIGFLALVAFLYQRSKVRIVHPRDPVWLARDAAGLKKLVEFCRPEPRCNLRNDEPMASDAGFVLVTPRAETQSLGDAAFLLPDGSLVPITDWWTQSKQYQGALQLERVRVKEGTAAGEEGWVVRTSMGVVLAGP